MNLKEAFRYQNLLERFMQEATSALTVQDNLVKTTRIHLRHKANSAAADETEPENPEYMDADALVKFAVRIIQERETLTTAIGEAKKHLHGSITDLDAAVEANKFRQSTAGRLKAMLRMKETKRTTPGTGYNFNAEGNQVPYVYDIEITTEVRFDRAAVKATMQKLLAKADEVSAAIDDAMINTTVDYEAPWDVNESFEDVFASFQEDLDKAG